MRNEPGTRMRETLEALLRAAKSVGEVGMTSQSAATYIDVTQTTTAQRLKMLVDRGDLVCRFEPGENNVGSRMRYWLKSCAPTESKPPKPTKFATLDKTAPAILTGKEKVTKDEGKQDFRFTVRLPADYVSQIDPRECRPWAMAAAR